MHGALKNADVICGISIEGAFTVFCTISFFTRIFFCSNVVLDVFVRCISAI